MDMNCQLIMKSYHEENDVMDTPKSSTTIRSCHCVQYCVVFPMSVSYSLDHEIMQLPGTGREL
jgi:hypothetical protein